MGQPVNNFDHQFESRLINRREWNRRISLASLAAAFSGSCVLFPADAHAQLATVKRAGVPYVRLDDVIKRYGFSRNFAGDTITLKSKWTRITFTLGNRIIEFNGLKMFLNASFVKLTATDWGVAEVDVLKTLDPLLRSAEFLKRVGSKTILIDPGHGGKDSGARNAGKTLSEKTAAYDIATRLRTRLLRERFNVRLTRAGDRTVGLYERAAQVGEVKADLLVSIHLNSAGSKTAAGIETFAVTLPGQRSTHDHGGGRPDGKRYHTNSYDGANLIAAHAIQSALITKTGATDRGVKRARFVVIREAKCPAVLVECGFLSNAAEAAKVASAAYRDVLADGIAHGVFDYMRKVRAAG